MSNSPKPKTMMDVIGEKKKKKPDYKVSLGYFGERGGKNGSHIIFKVPGILLLSFEHMNQKRGKRW